MDKVQLMRSFQLTTGSWVSALVVAAIAVVPALQASRTGALGSPSKTASKQAVVSKATPVRKPTLSALQFADDLNYATASSKGPGISTVAAILVDAASGDVLYAKQADAERSIASLSKLVSAMVILDAGVPMTTIQAISKEDAFRSSRSRFRAGTRMTLADLLQLSLMISDNRATRALARAVAGTYDSFAVLMNNKVSSLGLSHTRFVEPTGLNPANVSTAEEVARIILQAAKYQTISRITSTRLTQIKLLNTRRPTLFQIANTNDLITSRLRVMAGKTGYITAASYCLATIVQNDFGNMLTVVVLGAPGDKTRFRDARRLAEWGFSKV